MAEYIEREQVIALFDERKWQGKGCIYAVKELPTADVVKVVHGRWKYHKYVEKYECMECGHFVRKGTDRNYCPNCGAKMDMEKE